MVLVFAVFLVVSCQEHQNPAAVTDIDPEAESDHFLPDLIKLSPAGKIVVADRASGTISVINAANDELMDTYPLPAGDNPAEPMYVVNNWRNRTVFVGDRGNNRVVAFDSKNFSVKSTIPAGNGVFHMWADFRGKQLWVNNDISNTITVINPSTFSVITTIDIPADLVAMGGKPHDVILDPLGRNTFVSILGINGNSDYVVKYSTRTFQETGRAAVGQDPHLSLTFKNNMLYVPCQNSNAVYVLNRRTMDV